MTHPAATGDSSAGRGGTAAPLVVLVFPPLVATNFGRYYPSTAILAGYLGSQGLSATQLDLNEEFADYLATDEVVDLLGDERILGRSRDSVVAGAVRWAKANRAGLFDELGRHLSERSGPGANVLELLATPFAVDATRENMSSPPPRLQSIYLDFFEACEAESRLALDTALVGISVPMGTQLVPALILSKWLKSKRPNARIVLGGPTLTLMSPADLEALLSENREIDCAVQFDGEHALGELCRQSITGTWGPSGVPGVCCMSGDTFSRTPPAAGPDIDKLPPPEYSAKLLGRLSTPDLGITQARGCYWGKCDFCDHVDTQGASRRFRTRRPEAFVDEIELLVERTRISAFHFITDAIPPAFARRISNLILERGLEVTWNSFAMVDRHFDRNLLDLMVRAGCEGVVVGIESMNSRVLNLVHKSADRDENIRFIRDAHEAGMRLVINLIPDLPTTSFQEAITALADVEELAECIDGVQVFPFEFTRSSNIGRHPDKFGLEIGGGQNRGAAQFELNRLEMSDGAMSPDERANVQAKYVRFADAIASKSRSALWDATGGRSGVWRIRVQHIDVFPADDRTLCTQVRTRKALAISQPAATTLSTILRGEPFTWLDIRAHFGGPNADLLMRRLDSVGMIERLDSASSGPFADGLGATT